MIDELLPCGHDPLEVWDHCAGDQLSDHEQTCPYCQGVVEEYRIVAAPSRAWADAPIDAPDSLLERVMAPVRAGLRARSYLPLSSPYGPVQLDIFTAAAILRWAVDRVEGARARSCRIEPRDVAVVGDPGEAPPAPLVDIRLTIVARVGTPLLPLADEVRGMVRLTSDQLLGVAVSLVDVEIVDLWDPGVISPD